MKEYTETIKIHHITIKLHHLTHIQVKELISISKDDEARYQILRQLTANNVGLHKSSKLTLLTVWMAKLMFPAAKAVANEAFNMCDTMLSAGAEVTTTVVIATANVR